MTNKITPEAVKERIAALESLAALSLKEQFYLEALRLLVAGMDSEPVAWKVRFKLEGQPGSNFNKFFENRRAMNDVVSLHELGGFNIDVTPLYRHAQPAPVVPTFDEWLEIRGSKPLGWVKDAMRESYDACRAAMLQAGTLTNEDTKQAWTGIPDIDNAINMLDRIDTLESCDDDRIEAVKTVLRRLAGNSPVIPDGWKIVPIDATRAMIAAARRVEEDGYDAMHKAMLAAAPQPQNEPQNIPEIIPQWTPVSERMPEDRISIILWDAEIGEVTSGHYSHKTQTFYHCGDAIENEITHWMPPPCAPAVKAAVSVAKTETEGTEE